MIDKVTEQTCDHLKKKPQNHGETGTQNHAAFGQRTLVSERRLKVEC